MYRKLIVDPAVRAKRDELIDLPVIARVQGFDADNVKQFAADMEKAHGTGQTVIPVVIDSPGGSVYGLLDMIALVRRASLPVDTVVTGRAMSAGADLFCMGRRRFMAETATLMFHDAATFTGGKVEEVKADVAELDRLNRLVARLAAENIGQPAGYFLDEFHRRGHAEWFMTAREAKRRKICTHVRVPEMTVEVSARYTFR